MMMMTETSLNRIDFSKLGFEISVPSPDDAAEEISSPGSSSSHSNIEDNQATHSSSSSSNGGMRSSQDYPTSGSRVSNKQEVLNKYHNISIEPDDVSDYSDDNSSYGSEYIADEQGPFSPTKARQLNNHRYHRSTDFCNIPAPTLHTSNIDDATDLGYASMNNNNNVLPSRENLGYGDDAQQGHTPFSPAQLGYEECNNRRTSVQLVSVKGQPARNHRGSTDMWSRRLSSMERFSTCSGATGSRSSMSSFQRREQRVRRHSKSRPSQRERMVTRSSSRRLSRKHPAQVEVLRRKSTAGCCCERHIDDDEEEIAMKQTLQDLGCSELFLDPSRQRMPRRVSMEYGGGSCGTVSSSHKPKMVSLEFRDSSSVAGRSRTRMPRRVSIEYDQCETKTMGADGMSPKRVLRRRGSLDFSVGTSTLPRRGSLTPKGVLRRRGSLDFSVGRSTLPRRGYLGKGGLQQQPQQHKGTTTSSKNAPRSNSLGRQTALQQEMTRQQSIKTAPKPRRASYGGAFMRRSSLSSSSGRWGDRDEEEDVTRPVSRQPSDNTKTSRLSTRRSSIAHIPRKQIGHRLSITHVGAVEYLTRDTLVGRSA